jgi:hypothetical protein
MRLPILTGVVVLGLAGAGGAVPGGQARERSVYVGLVDKSDKPVPDAGPEAFIIQEDGVRREVLRVRRATDPAQIALLIDTSQAATPAMQDIRTAVEAFINTMAGPHELAVITVGERPTIQAEYTTNKTLLLDKGVGRLFAIAGSGAYLLDGIVETANGQRKREAARRIIVAITTEGTEFSNRHYDTVLKALKDSGSALHALLLPPIARDLGNDEVRNRNMVFDRGTSESGGRRKNLLSSMALADELKSLGAEINAQYLVTYGRPESLIPPEKIEVKAANPSQTARGTAVQSGNSKK